MMSFVFFSTFGAPLVFSIYIFSFAGLAHGAPLTTLRMCLGSLFNNAELFVCLFVCLLYSDILAVSSLTRSLSSLKSRRLL
ncbi:MAG: hypothetical protein JOS17DRAFT_754918, partial [Linnemannia elongata]